MTRQFFEASCPQGHFFETTKKPMIRYGLGDVCTKFQVCIVFSLAGRHDTQKYINTNTSANRNILNRLLASHGFWLNRPLCQFYRYLYNMNWISLNFVLLASKPKRKKNSPGSKRPAVLFTSCKWKSESNEPLNSFLSLGTVVYDLT